MCEIRAVSAAPSPVAAFAPGRRKVPAIAFRGFTIDHDVLEPALTELTQFELELLKLRLRQRHRLGAKFAIVGLILEERFQT